MKFPQYIGPRTKPKPSFGALTLKDIPRSQVVRQKCADWSRDPDACEKEALRVLIEVSEAHPDWTENRIAATAARQMKDHWWFAPRWEGLPEFEWEVPTASAEEDTDVTEDPSPGIIATLKAAAEDEDSILIPALAGTALGLLAFFGIIMRSRG